MAEPISIAEFKTRFPREFPYGTGLDSVRDADIQNAFDSATLLYNPSLFTTAEGKVAFAYASAHFVAVSIQSAGGLSPVVSGDGVNNRSNGVVLGKSVGQVSVNYADVPSWLKKFPTLMGFWETEYGKRYVMMVCPRLVGNVALIPGWIDGSNEGGEYVAVPPVPDAGP